jgi:hypothetical protein
MQRVKGFLTDIRFIVGLYFISTIVVSIQKINSNSINNVLIFRSSFLNFINQIDLYSLHPEQHYDYYKYSPLFAILMAPFAMLPSLWAALVWNLVNAILFLVGVKMLEVDTKSKKIFLWLCFFEFLTSMNYFQSNVMMSGLMLLTFASFSRLKPFVSGILSMLLLSIKIFGASVASIFILYPKKNIFILSAFMFAIVSFLLCVLLSSFEYTTSMYVSWFKLLLWDFDASLGLSVMALINKYVFMPKLWIQVIGTLFTFAPIIICWLRGPRGVSRASLISAVMIWSVIFNHKAETATFIIAVTGSILWFTYSKKTLFDKAIIVLVFIFTTLSPTELFPKPIVEILGGKDLVKLTPCILVWIKILFDEWITLLSLKGHQSYR